MDVLLEVLKWVDYGTSFVFLLGIILGAFRMLWVPGFAYREVKQERDNALTRVDRVLVQQEATADALEKLTTAVITIKDSLDELESTVRNLVNEIEILRVTFRAPESRGPDNHRGRR